MAKDRVRWQSDLEDMSARVESLELLVGADQTPMVACPGITELQDKVQHFVADTAADMMTGLRWRQQQKEYVQAYQVYRQLLGSVAVDTARHALDSTGDTGDIKRAVYAYLRSSKQRMVELDYQKRLEKSRVERSKQWLAHHPKSRFVGALAVSASTTSALFAASDEYATLIDLDISPAKATGMAGIGALVLANAMRSVLRTGPTKAGAALSRQFNATLSTYELAKRDAQAASIAELPRRYADRHLTIPLGAAAAHLTNYDLTRGPEWIVGSLSRMVDETLDITEGSMLETYGIDPQKLETVPWYRRLAA